MQVTSPSEREAIWWPFDSDGCRRLAADLDDMAVSLKPFLTSLTRPKGRPRLDAENAWIRDFAELVKEAVQRRTRQRPEFRQDEVGRRLFEVFFGWERELPAYRRNRQTLARQGTRVRRGPRAQSP
jgi:hypothetical protein